MKVLVNNYLEDKEELVEVKDFEEASDTVRKIIDDNDLGASHWYLSENTGNVYDNDKLVGRISYNGRIWTIDENGKEVSDGNDFNS